MLIIPGGMPRSTNLNEHKPLKDLIVKYDKEGKYIAAICAAPMVFGELGLLENKKATCYPGFESHLKGAILCTDYAVEDGNIITGKGPAAASAFGFKIVETLKDKNTSDAVAKGMLFI